MSYPSSACPTSPCILVVDDSRLARAMVRKALGKGWRIIEASCGPEAIEKFQAYKPWAVVMDLTMPGMNGLEAITRIKQLEPKAKIVVVTADIQEGSVRMARERGALAVLPKPLDPQKITSLLKELFS